MLACLIAIPDNSLNRWHQTHSVLYETGLPLQGKILAVQEISNCVYAGGGGVTDTIVERDA